MAKKRSHLMTQNMEQIMTTMDMGIAMKMNMIITTIMNTVTMRYITTIMNTEHCMKLKT